LSLPWVRTWLLPSASSTVSMQHTNLIASAIFLLPARLWSPLHLHQQRKVASMCCQCQKFSQASKYVKRSRFLLYQFLNHLDHWKTDGQMITLVARYVGYLVNAALVEVGEQRAKELQERADMLLLAERESHAIKLKVSSLIRSARDHGRPADLDGNWQIKSMTQGTSYFLHRLVIKGNQVTLADGARSKLKRVHGTLYIEGGAVELTGKELHRQGKSAESHQIYVRADVKHIQEANQENDIIDMESVVPKVSHNSSVSTPRCSSCWDLVAMLQDVDLEDQDVDDRKDHASHKESAFESCHNSVVLTEEYEHDTFATLQELDHQDQDEDDQDQELLPSVAAALHGKR